MPAIAVELDYEVHMLNMQMAFLIAAIGENVFVKIALDYETNDKAGAPFVMKLKTNLVRSLAEPERLVRHDRREARQHRPQRTQIGFVRIHPRGRDWLRHPYSLCGRHYLSAPASPCSAN